jgi:uncharacterized membrane protein
MMLYNFFSWGMIMFGLILFWSTYELIKYMETANEIIGMLFLGTMGSVMFCFGVIALWEQWKKKA